MLFFQFHAQLLQSVYLGVCYFILAVETSVQVRSQEIYLE